MKRLAHFFSYLFHPLFIPTYTVFLFLVLDSTLYLFVSNRFKLILLLMTFLFTAALPLLNVVLLVRLKHVESIFLHQKEERSLAYIIGIIFFIAQYYVLGTVNELYKLRLFFLGASIALAIAFFINTKTKISAHMIALGGLLGTLISLSSTMNVAFLTPLVIGACGIVGTSRLALNAHTNTQIYLGFLIGLISEIGIFFTSGFINKSAF